MKSGVKFTFAKKQNENNGVNLVSEKPDRIYAKFCVNFKLDLKNAHFRTDEIFRKFVQILANLPLASA